MGKTRVNSADYTQASGANNIILKMGDTKRRQCTRAGMGNNKLVEWELQKNLDMTAAIGDTTKKQMGNNTIF